MSFLTQDATIKNTVFEKVETNVDIPLDDTTAYQLYPKYNWVYSTSRLLDMQNIAWSPFPRKGFDFELKEFHFVGDSGKIYTEQMNGDRLTTDVAVMKGDIKWAAHHALDAQGNKTLLNELRGDVELVISALTTLYFKKFAGIISVDTIGTKIVAVRLRMTADMVDKYPEDWLKRVMRIYNRRPWGK